jgi:hypothetical protein
MCGNSAGLQQKHQEADSERCNQRRPTEIMTQSGISGIVYKPLMNQLFGP